ncbi:unnamed protein product [Adineta steineri]|uniref:Uncharacterized protein n=1 Tax=Adineta steineri TaxID=433720 RepID=A0A814DFI8_9BILA|nr:unnamed protein product [Adineta steineri]CAF1191472.1 unnamed protein product [Adineta steineri]
MESLNKSELSQWIICKNKLKSLSSFRSIILFITIIVLIVISSGSIKLKPLEEHRIYLYSKYKNATSFIFFNSIEKQNKNFTSTILNSKEKKTFDVVLSYYAEDQAFVGRYIRYIKNVSSLQQLNIRIIIYNKNSNVNNTQLKVNLKADIVYGLSNIGREGATFLYHIISNYNKLADHIIFSQAGVEGINDKGLDDWYYDRLQNQFNSSLGYMPLVVNHMISKDMCGHHPTGNFLRLVDLWGMLQQTLCPTNGFSVAFRGQFLVSKQRILQKPLSIYKYIYEIITGHNTHWIHTDPRAPPGFYSKPEQPVFGYVVERAWTIIFNCTGLDLADRCAQKKCGCYD